MLKKVSISFAATLLGLVLLEFGWRAWLAHAGRPYDSAQVERQIQQMLDPIRGFVPPGVEIAGKLQNGLPLPVLHPYSGAELEHDTGNVLAYFREHPDSPDYEVVVLGGSVAAFLTAGEGDRLARIIGADPRVAGRNVKILNYAHASYKEPQQLNRLAYLLTLGARPEAVINIDGFNEVALAIENAHTGTHPVYPSAPTWAASAGGFGVGAGIRMDVVVQLYALREDATAIIGHALRWKFARSCLLGAWTLGRLNAINTRRAELQNRVRSLEDTPRIDARLMRQVHGPDFPEDERARMDMCVNAWVEGSISIDAVCRARGIQYLHVLQPALGDTGSKPLSDEEQAIRAPSADWMEGPRVGYPLMRERSKELVVRGIAFLDASRAFEAVTAGLYVDPCHMDARGNAILADLIGPAFCRLLAAK